MQTMIEIPKAIVLWSKEGRHAGFMLLSHEEGNEYGECVFMLSPVSAEGIDSEMGIVVSELKVAGEQQFHIKRNESGYELTVKPRELPEVVFKLNTGFEGDVFTEFNGPITTIGTANPAKQNA
ncbi:MAG: hypothetical protein COW62_05530 [Zetaproteobacteria bacterium CG17_big_fil_post_rev_8_21_14_2_50_50_13]|nr:MAG: hypothetical protein AUJ57_12170 [Zetaproteobacteria bacterium CG1_02_53_45]PIQ33375.1 MAG: hypothetical protein COW62_05530 [Zetaproteobacteria bacterium CG17_big_fil_post_rev_8_21_14_2_50_50_13]PIY57015.1 MAG: hypothetical protein COZ00_01195 [Zetaproteobacteria bacterium CG_4_10_14_0_8_um_filter_49_80]